MKSKKFARKKIPVAGIKSYQKQKQYVKEKGNVKHYFKFTSPDTSKTP